MKGLVQRVNHASVYVENKLISSVSKGLLVFVGIFESDTEETLQKFCQKVENLRIFEDENGKTNLNLEQVEGELLVVSQFTLYADCRKGNRPSFTNAMEPSRAEELYDYIVDELKKQNAVVETGEFGADMKVSLINDGPFTIILDSNEIMPK